MAQLLRPWSVQGPAGLRFVDGRGIWLTAADGRRYIDMCSQLMAVNLGHGDRRVTDAVGRQMAQVSYVNPAYETESRAEVTERLAEILPPGIDRILLTTGGAEAVENAIKLARIVTGRPKIITRYRSYHGATAAAITASGDPRRHPTAAFETPGIVRIEDPYCYRCPWHHHPETCELECLAHVERIITLEGPETIAGIMLEGESGTSGCIKYPLGYWKRIESIARKYGILLIADEVMSGFGRCGDWFAVTRHGVTPDIIVMAKGLTSGYVPMGGIAVRGSLIFPRFEQDVLPLGLTYAAHPLGCAAATACITAYQADGLIERAAALEAVVLAQMDSLKRKFDCIGDYRTTGLLGVLELVSDPKTKNPIVPWNAYGSEAEPGIWLNRRLVEAGLLPIVRWNYLFIAPPLIITEPELAEITGRIQTVFTEFQDRYLTRISRI